MIEMERHDIQSELTDNQKIGIMRSVFTEFNGSKNQKYIKNPGDFITTNFEKINGFDFRWSSLISNNPLLFEDINYLRVKSFIDNKISDKEISAYKNGDLRELYSTFDSLLICNLKYYDRIINYCTMIFMHYLIIDDNIIKGKTAKLEDVPYELSITPTKIWCAVLANTSSTSWELNYGWNVKTINPIIGSDKSVFELSWSNLYKNETFRKFVEWASYRCDTNGYRETMLADITSNRKLSQVCLKFTNQSVAISEQQLDSVFDYVKNIDDINRRLYYILDKCLFKMFDDKSMYGIYIFTNDFYILSSKFQIKVSKSPKGIISKEYLANTYECFIAEEHMMESIKTQIEWAKFKNESHYEYDKKILESLLYTMLHNDYRNTLCFKRIAYDEMNGMTSKITFQGIFNNVKIIESFMFDNRILKTNTITLGKRNAAKYIIDRGYYVFGTEKDVFLITDINKNILVSHYNNYCIPVINYMKDVIDINIQNKNEIIDVIINGLDDSKINNVNIKYTSIKNVDPKQILAKGLEYQNKQILQKKKSYWGTINSY